MQDDVQARWSCVYCGQDWRPMTTGGDTKSKIPHEILLRDSESRSTGSRFWWNPENTYLQISDFRNRTRAARFVIKLEASLVEWLPTWLRTSQLGFDDFGSIPEVRNLEICILQIPSETISPSTCRLLTLAGLGVSLGDFRAASRTVVGRQAPRVEASQGFYYSGFIQTNKQTNNLCGRVLSAGLSGVAKWRGWM